MIPPQLIAMAPTLLPLAQNILSMVNPEQAARINPILAQSGQVLSQMQRRPVQRPAMTQQQRQRAVAMNRGVRPGDAIGPATKEEGMSKYIPWAIGAAGLLGLGFVIMNNSGGRRRR